MRFKVRIDPNAAAKIDAVEEAMRDAIFGAGLDTYNALIEPGGEFGTPRDTGFAAGMWWLQSDGSPASHPAGDEGVNTGGPDLGVLRDSVGRILSIVNSAAYIRRLEEGHSRQNQGFTARVANHYDDFLNARLAAAKAKML